MNALSQPFAALILSAALLPWMVAAETPAASSNTVIGPNVMLADGAEALMRGDWQRGIQLTQMGLTFAVTQQDRASALANLCAGFAALKQYQRALEHCDQSIGSSGQLADVAEPRGRESGVGQDRRAAARHSARAAAQPGLGFVTEDARDRARSGKTPAGAHEAPAGVVRRSPLQPDFERRRQSGRADPTHERQPSGADGIRAA